jgi:predicted naringenin-chalcone synthase
MTLESKHPAILAIGTAVPNFHATQDEICTWMSESFGALRRPRRFLRMVSNESGIDKRHSCAPQFQQPPRESALAPGIAPEHSATTTERMTIFERESVPLGMKAARCALERFAQRTRQAFETVRDSVTHVIGISCTGLFAPGLDFALVRDLDLPPTTRRTFIGFMGCSAMFNGLRAAAEIVRGDPEARVLVVSVELCTLHSQPSDELDNLVSAMLFADGSSACLVGMPTADDGDYFSLEDFYTEVKPNTEDEMIWKIGQYGYTLRLSPRIPAHLAEVAPVGLNTLFPADEADFWAIHPGGRAIVDGLETTFDLKPGALDASRAVLREYGNMSSATILFVLEHMQEKYRQTADAVSGVAMAFGPGLVVEMARLSYVPASEPVAVPAEAASRA